MTDQGKLTESGEITFDQPTTWDNQPMFSSATVREGLFDAEAFEQMAGQTALETDKPDNSVEAVAARRDMFRGFGWGVS